MSLNHRTAPTPVPDETGGHGLLAGKIVVITAAAGTGIGQTTARRCLEEGATVVISDAHPRRLEETAAELRTQFDAEVLAVPCDVTNEEQVVALYDAVIARYGRIDVAVNNAGLGGTSNIVDMTDEQWSKVLDVTLTGTFRCTRAVLKHMYAAKSGVIVNNASVLGWRAQPGQAHYAAAKAGVEGLALAAAASYARFGVRVNCVAPGLTRTDLTRALTQNETIAKLSAALHPLGRIGEPEEVASAICWLLDAEQKWVTGQVIGVDGGLGRVQARS